MYKLVLFWKIAFKKFKIIKLFQNFLFVIDAADPGRLAEAGKTF
jgi:hypothetical protein